MDVEKELSNSKMEFQQKSEDTHIKMLEEKVEQMEFQKEADDRKIKVNGFTWITDRFLFWQALEMSTTDLKKNFETTVERLTEATEYSREVENDLDAEKERSKSLLDQLCDTSKELSKSQDTHVNLTEKLTKTEGTNSLSCVNS